MSREERSIVERLEDAGQRPPRVRLAAPLHEEGSPASTQEVVLRRNGRYEVLGELAEGGVGEVLRGRDVDLGRDVALKVLRRERSGDPDILQRFVDEAQIGAQLQHPGIVPVYELGLQDDGRPFFSMKLVKGQTLAALLKRRESPAKERRRFLQIFEQICQTVAYAHARGVVHRDLKPANVMVGSFGEMQVLDWGFAKVLARGGIADERAPKEPDVTQIATLRSGAEGSHSIAGSVMGTPAYMPPEQAMGLVAQLDERSDVFSLGAILCEILTGEAPYTGEDRIVQAAQCLLADAHARLDTCGAHQTLVELTRRCLQPRRADRPADAAQLAQAVHEHVVAVEERAQRARVRAAEEKAAARNARADAKAQRTARRQTRRVAAAVLLAVLIGASGYAWIEAGRRERAARSRAVVQAALDQAIFLQGEGRLGEALAAAERAQSLGADADLDAALRARSSQLAASVRHAKADADAQAAREQADADFLDALREVPLSPAGDFDAQRIDRSYHEAFLARGVDVDADAPAEASAKLEQVHGPIAVAVAVALDNWAQLRRTSKELADKDAGRPLALARRLDPDPRRSDLRDAFAAGKTDALEALVAAEAQAQWPAVTRAAFGLGLHFAGANDAAVGVLQRLLLDHPDDFTANRHLGLVLEQTGRPAQAVPYFGAALALRPKSLISRVAVAASLHAAGQDDDALAHARLALEEHPENGTARHWVAFLLSNGNNRPPGNNIR